LATCLLVLSGASSAQAQGSAPAQRWSFDIAAGFDNSVSGNINSSAIGTINNQTTVITKNSYEDVYGTGLHLRFGGGYMMDDVSEIRGTFSFQSLDADVTPMGDVGASNLYAEYDDYQAFVFDVGFRRYHEVSPAIQAYGEGTIGIGFVDATDVRLVAPASNFDLQTDFFDQTAAFALGANVGMLVRVTSRLDGFGQLGMRYVTGQGKVDESIGTGLESINDNTARWTIPFVVGVRVRL
jgi:opacity protein-like surface antigen